MVEFVINNYDIFHVVEEPREKDKLLPDRVNTLWTLVFDNVKLALFYWAWVKHWWKVVIMSPKFESQISKSCGLSLFN